MERIPDDLGTAFNVQMMVFGNMGKTPGTGFAFTRNPIHGAMELVRRLPPRAGSRLALAVRDTGADQGAEAATAKVYAEFEWLRAHARKALSRRAGPRVTIEGASSGCCNAVSQAHVRGGW